MYIFSTGEAMKKLVIFISLWGSYIGLNASDGTLDPSFGAGAGFVDGPAGTRNAFAVAIQPDGKIVAMGRSQTAGNPRVAIVVRYNTDGSVDTTFGVDGVVTDTTNMSITDGFLQPDGKIVIVGNDTTNTFFQLIRYNSNGTLDMTFGTNGVVIGPVGNGQVVDIQIDGKIVVAGTNQITGLFQVVRYLTNGTIDVIFQPGPSGDVYGIAIQANGQVLAIGYNFTTNIPGLIRYNTNGTLDSSYVVTGLPDERFFNIVLQPNGQAIVGANNVAENQIWIARVNTNGSIDTTFGGGVTTGPAGSINGMVLQADGKPILLGANTGQSPQLIRYTTAGVLDATFGTGGIVQTPPGDPIEEGALQTNGYIVAVGGATGLASYQVARYISEPVLAPTTINVSAGVSDTVALSGTAQNPSQIYVYNNGTFVGGTVTDPVNFTNTWSFSAPDGSGTYSVVAYYRNGRIDTSTTSATTVCERSWLINCL